MTDSQACLAAYGDPSQAKFQGTWLVRHALPAAVLPFFPPYPGVPKVTAIYLNKFAAAALDAVLLDLLATGLIKELKTYDGCLNLRQKRGIKEYSVHSWGLALDFNASRNPLGVKWGSQPGMFSPAFVALWEKHGWVAGARWGRADAQHFQYTARFPAK